MGGPRFPEVVEKSLPTWSASPFDTVARKNSSSQQPAGIKKCNHPRCLTCSFLQEGQTNYTFFTTNEARKITDSIFCHSKNLIYLIECKKCHLQYIGETKRQLNEHFGEHRRSILNHQQLSITTPVSLHFNQAGHSINDVLLIPIELIRSKRDSVRKTREAHLINKAKTLHPFGINRRGEARQWHPWHLFTHSLPIIVAYFYLNL